MSIHTFELRHRSIVYEQSDILRDGVAHPFCIANYILTYESFSENASIKFQRMLNNGWVINITYVNPGLSAPFNIANAAEQRGARLMGI